jgi:hypothetical protein
MCGGESVWELPVRVAKMDAMRFALCRVLTNQFRQYVFFATEIQRLEHKITAGDYGYDLKTRQIVTFDPAFCFASLELLLLIHPLDAMSLKTCRRDYSNIKRMNINSKLSMHYLAIQSERLCRK